MERYSMNDWQPLTILDKKMRVEEEINQLTASKEPLVNKKKEIELELSELNNKIRVNGFIDQNEYANICKRQDDLKRIKHGVEQQLLSLKQQVRNKQTEKDKLTIQGKKFSSSEIKQCLLGLREKYMSFASDTTRVSSMRAMASKFVEELQAALKHVD